MHFPLSHLSKLALFTLFFTSYASSSHFREPLIKNSLHTRAAYTFNPSSNQNIAVYYGRTDLTTNTNLSTLCNDTNIDIVILAFIADVFGGGGYPNMSFDQLCSGQTETMINKKATGLVDCSNTLGPQIIGCQSLGKKVFVALGGQNGDPTFTSALQAKEGAEMMWNLFATGTEEDAGLRPFGNAKVDGFDLDNETGNNSFYDDFVSALRNLINSQKQKGIYLSASPTCSFTSGPPPAYLNQLDFVWPQFYAAPSCNIGGDGFNQSIINWTSQLSGPKLYIGSPSWANGTSNGGYEDPDEFKQTIWQARRTAKKEFGGVMLWDGAYGRANVDAQGVSYVANVKMALRS